MGRYYTDFADFLSLHFPGKKMQKLTVDGGFSCPNRDGTFSTGGCAYCNNSSFSPGMVGGSRSREGVAAQLGYGRKFFARKYPEMRYLAYFQSYTNTHGEMSRLMALYREALAQKDVDGLIIGTRPDCLPPELLTELAGLHQEKWVMIEIGAESSHDETLRRVNRCHTWGCVEDAVSRVRDAGMPVGLHLIMGLPGESDQMMMQTVERMAALHPDTVKFHQLQVVEGSSMARQWRENPDELKLFTPENYLDLCCKVVEKMNQLSPSTALERFTSSAPAELLLAPRWGLKNYQFVNLLHNRLAALEQ